MVPNKLRKVLPLKVEYERIFSVFLPNVPCYSNHAVREVTLWHKKLVDRMF